MLVRLETADDVGRERITQLLQYSLNGHREDIDSMQLSVATIQDPLGTKLHRCRLRALLRHGPPIEVEEVQSRLDLTVTRALDRCVRKIQRRRHSFTQRHSA
jgi:hypothetical protein